jgi:hypothetical protein
MEVLERMKSTIEERQIKPSTTSTARRLGLVEALDPVVGQDCSPLPVRHLQAVQRTQPREGDVGLTQLAEYGLEKQAEPSNSDTKEAKGKPGQARSSL